MQRSKTLLNIENDLRRYMDEHTHVSPKRVPAAMNQHVGKVAMASDLVFEKIWEKQIFVPKNFGLK